jgi:acyl-CoA synthetase (AMP-forming)/AMP-acid ligase II
MVLVELFATLCYGGSLVLKDANDPFEHLKHVNAMVATPSLLSSFSPEDYTNLDVVLLAGEPVSQTLADTWAAKVPTLLNLYGPSEVRSRDFHFAFSILFIDIVPIVRMRIVRNSPRTGSGSQHRTANPGSRYIYTRSPAVSSASGNHRRDIYIRSTAYARLLG